MSKEKELKKLKKELWEKLDDGEKKNTKLINNQEIKFGDFENNESKYGWYIYQIKFKNNYIIKKIKNTKKTFSSVYQKILKELENNKIKKVTSEVPVVAAIVDIDNNIISIKRNIKCKQSENIGHAEQQCLKEIEEKCSEKHNKKLRIFITIIPCIECFKKICDNKNINEIFILKEYKISLIKGSYINFLKDEKNNKKYNLFQVAENNKTIEKINSYHDKYIIKKMIKDNFLEKYLEETKNSKIQKIELSKISYFDMEKTMILLKYIKREILWIDFDKEILFVDIKKLFFYIKNFKEG